MFQCKICKTRFNLLRKYELHQYYHRNAHGVMFYCLKSNCNFVINNYSSFKSHLFRYHSISNNCRKRKLFHCTHRNCFYKNENKKTFLKHIYGHIRGGIPLQCPFHSVCNSTSIFSNVDNLRVHIMRKHCLENEKSYTELSKNVIYYNSNDAQTVAFISPKVTYYRKNVLYKFVAYRYRKNFSSYF